MPGIFFIESNLLDFVVVVVVVVVTVVVAVVIAVVVAVVDIDIDWGLSTGLGVRRDSKLGEKSPWIRRLTTKASLPT